MQDKVYLLSDFDVFGSVLGDQGKLRVIHEVSNVFGFTGNEIVQTDNLMVVSKEFIC